MRPFWKSAIMQSLEPMQNPHFSWKIKIPKICQNPFYKSFTVVLCKKPLEKRRNIREMRPFSKSAIMQRPMKNLNLGQKWKFQKTCQNPFYKSFRVVLYKKPPEKTLNIGEMRAFWKLAII